MDGLTDLSGLSSVQSVQYMRLQNNASIESLAGADALTALTRVETFANPKLTQASFEAFIAQFTPAPDVCFETCDCGVIDDDSRAPGRGPSETKQEARNRGPPQIPTSRLRRKGGEDACGESPSGSTEGSIVGLGTAIETIRAADVGAGVP